jgi:hypothetical protein
MFVALGQAGELLPFPVLCVHTFFAEVIRDERLRKAPVVGRVRSPDVCVYKPWG